MHEFVNFFFFSNLICVRINCLFPKVSGFILFKALVDLLVPGTENEYAIARLGKVVVKDLTITLFHP